MENPLFNIELSALRLKEAKTRESIDALRTQSADLERQVVELEKRVVESESALIRKSKTVLGHSNMLLLSIGWCVVFLALHAIYAKEAFSVFFLMASAPGLFSLLHHIIQLRNE